MFVVNRWGPSVILLVCSGDSWVCGLDLCSGVTGLGARWSSGTSLNSLKLRGSGDSTVSFLLLRRVSIGRRNLVSRSCFDYSVLLDR